MRSSLYLRSRDPSAITVGASHLADLAQSIDTVLIDDIPAEAEPEPPGHKAGQGHSRRATHRREDLSRGQRAPLGPAVPLSGESANPRVPADLQPPGYLPCSISDGAIPNRPPRRTSPVMAPAASSVPSLAVQATTSLGVVRGWASRAGPTNAEA